ncbi:MAG: UPF0149 family protein [Burkholderiaceae bacterium]|nr:UPF0149 family protein [Burkholderiaceae bacterium]
MKPFVDYIASHPAVLADHHPLSEAEQDELFEALNQPGLPDECMTAEMADGFLTGCALSPQAVDMADWLEEVFGQVSMPNAGSPAATDRLLSLVLRRWRDIQHGFASDVVQRVLHTGELPHFGPLIGQVDADEVVHPVRLDEEERRMGEWLGRDWAVGFFSAIQRDETWKHLLEDEAHWAMVAPVLVFFQGYDAAQPDWDLDGDPEAISRLVHSLYRISAYWRTFHAALQAH